MYRRLILGAVLTLLAVSPAAAQEVTGAQVYIAYYQVGFDDLEDYIGLFQQNDVPILQELQEEGVIAGFGLQMHNTAGEYNIRFAVRSDDWASFGDFWSEYLGRSEQRHPRDFERASEMLQAHTDEIWDITSSNVPTGQQFTYMYDSKFQVAFSEMEAWNAAWTADMVPMLDQAIADGILGGWVIENHNTGGPDNWKILYLFESWDTIDDLFGRILPAAMGNPRLKALMGSAVQAHDDIIWETVPPSGN